MYKKNLLLLFLFFLIVVSLILFFILTFLRSSGKTQVIPQSIPTPTVYQQPSPTPQGKGRGFESQEFLQEENSFVANTPILQKLPAGSSFFSIEYINEQNLIVHAKTTDTQRDYQEAEKWFARNNIDISKIIIEYK